MWPEDTYISCPEDTFCAPLGTTWSTLSSGPDEDEAPATGKTALALPMSAMGTTEEALQEPPDRFRAALLILYL